MVKIDKISFQTSPHNRRLRLTPMRGARPIVVALAVRLLVANVIAGVLVTAFLLLTFGGAGGDRAVDPTVQIVSTALAFVGSLCVLGPVAFLHGRRRFAVAISWLNSDRPPQVPERAAVLNAPWVASTILARYWLVVAIGVGVAQGVTGPRRAVSLVAVTALGGLTACAATYFLVERALRPVFARVLADGTTERPRTLRMHARFGLAWVLGSGLPLLGVALTPILRIRGADVEAWIPMAFLALVGLGAGAALIVAAVNSVVAPVQRIRAALETVRAGNLDESVVVDDAGEIGEVQAAFNDMVAGLRERQRLQDLFGRHVGEGVARRALERGVELSGEAQQASILFVDLVSSTELVASRPAHEVVDTLNSFFAAVVATTDEMGGWVNKFAGDGALCVFGPPAGSADHAEHALRAARLLADRLRHVAAGIGVSSGEVVAGNVGAEDRYEYTVIGLPVNEAARLTDAAKSRPGRVLASGRALDASGSEADYWRPAGSVELRGLPGVYETHEPVGNR